MLYDPGQGEWSHRLATPDNACNSDMEGGARQADHKMEGGKPTLVLPQNFSPLRAQIWRGGQGKPHASTTQIKGNPENEVPGQGLAPELRFSASLPDEYGGGGKART